MEKTDRQKIEAKIAELEAGENTGSGTRTVIFFLKEYLKLKGDDATVSEACGMLRDASAFMMCVIDKLQPDG